MLLQLDSRQWRHWQKPQGEHTSTMVMNMTAHHRLCRGPFVSKLYMFVCNVCNVVPVSILYASFISQLFFVLLASCSSGCINGDCVSPNNCSCNAHSHGISCNICDDGWTGADCMTPICLSGCQHGSCTIPNTCVCDPRWNGTKCEVCADGWSTPAKLCTIGLLISRCSSFFVFNLDFWMPSFVCVLVYWRFLLFQLPVRQIASTEVVIILGSATAILVTVAQHVLLKPLQVESIHAAFLTLLRLAIWLMANYSMTVLPDILELPLKHALTFLASTATSVARLAVTVGQELTA